MKDIRFYFIVIIAQVLFFQISSRSQNPEILLPLGHDLAINDIVFSSDGRIFCTIGKDNKVIIWDSNTQLEIWSAYLGDYNLTSMEMSSDGRFLFIGNSIGILFFIDILNRELKGVYENSINPIKSINTSKDLERIVFLSDLEEEKGSVVTIISLHEQSQDSIKKINFDTYVYHAELISKDTLMTITSKKVIFWVLPDCKKISARRIKKKMSITSVNFSKEKELIAFGTLEGHIFLYDLKTKKFNQIQVQHLSSVKEIEFVEQSDYLFSLSLFSTMCYDLNKEILNYSILDSTAFFRTIEVSPTKEYVIIGNEDENFGLEGSLYLRDFSQVIEFFSKNEKNKDSLWGKNHKTMSVRDFKSGKLLNNLGRFANIPETVSTSKDLTKMVVGYQSGNISLWDLEHMQLVNSFNGSLEISCSAISENKDIILIGSTDGKIIAWDTRNPFLIDTTEILTKEISTTVAITPNEDYYVIGIRAGEILVWDRKLNKKLKTISFRDYGDELFMPISLDFSKDGQYLFVSSIIGTIYIIDMDTLKVINDFPAHLYSPINSIKIDNENNTFSTASDDGTVKVWNYALLDSLIENHPQNYDYAHVLKVDYNNSFAENLSPKHIFSFEDEVWVITYSKNGYFLGTGSKDGSVKTWDIRDGKLVSSFINEGQIIGISFLKDSLNQLVFKRDKYSFDFFDNSKNMMTAKFYSSGLNNWFITTHNNYYISSKSNIPHLGFLLHDKIFTFEQFDLIYNRPDIIFSTLNLDNPDLNTLFLKAYEKRKKKYDLKISKFEDKISAPNVSIKNRNLLPRYSEVSKVTLSVSMIDSLNYLARLFVYINDVPIYGISGINLRQKNTKIWEQTLNLTLSKGENKIQISALNQGGAESLKETFYITYDAPKEKPTLYLIGIAAEDFPNDKLDLTYPNEDIQDFIQTYKSNSAAYKKIVIDTLKNSEITPQNLQQLKTTLRQSKVDDQVILFVAGHGLLDDSLNYYLATPNTNFSNPSEGGILYEDLENLLDGIPARQKLFLMDACHSGEIDKEEVELIEKQTAKKDNLFSRSFGKVPQPKNLGLVNSFELMKQLFVDLRRGTGATVISSASGVEFAWEGKQWKNSVFTYCLLSGLTENKENSTIKKADLNEDGQIMVSELQQYLATEVAKLTKGHQQPTMRVENISNDWQVW